MLNLMKRLEFYQRKYNECYEIFDGNLTGLARCRMNFERLMMQCRATIALERLVEMFAPEMYQDENAEWERLAEQMALKEDVLDGQAI